MTRLTSRSRLTLAGRSFAFERERKEPIENANHVRNAIARFTQVAQVSDAERDQAWERILAAARRFHVSVHHKSWRDLK